MSIKITNVKMIEVFDWNELVSNTYGRPYDFQQQDGCKPRGTFNITIPSTETCDEEMLDFIPERVNGDIMGVTFKVWLERDPKQLLKNEEDRYDWSISLFWDRNFYPDIQMVANDLHKKGLIDAGDYIINIDW